MRKVTERDFRKPEFVDSNPDDYEFRDGDNKIVRKDRWKSGMMQIAIACGFSIRSGFEISDVVEHIESIMALEKDWMDYQPGNLDYDQPTHQQVTDIKLRDGSIHMNVIYNNGLGKFVKHNSANNIIIDHVIQWREHIPVKE